MFEESSKSRGVFRTQASIYGGAFLWIYLTAYYFCNKSSVIDVRLGYIALRKYWNFQSEGKAEQTIAICTTYSVFLLQFVQDLTKLWLILLVYSGSFDCHVSSQLRKLKTVLRTCLLINPFHVTGLFLHPWKKSENLWFPGVFRAILEISR